MIDNRFILPPGCKLGRNKDGSVVVFMWSVNEAGDRFDLSGYRSHGFRAVVCRDYISSAPKESGTTPAWHRAKDLAFKNHEENIAKHTPQLFLNHEKVLLCGGGPSVPAQLSEIEAARSMGYYVIVLSRAARHVSGDLFIGIEPNPGGLPKDILMDKTPAHFLTTCNPDQIDRPWRSVSFGRLGIMPGPDDMPIYNPHETVSGIALEYICRVLRAKKIVMTGMEHPPRGNYYYHGIELQAMCWHASRHGVEVWNCSDNTTAVAGLILGTITEAIGGGK
jgi:hypothetical protein